MSARSTKKVEKGLGELWKKHNRGGRGNSEMHDIHCLVENGKLPYRAKPTIRIKNTKYFFVTRRSLGSCGVANGGHQSEQNKRTSRRGDERGKSEGGAISQGCHAAHEGDGEGRGKRPKDPEKKEKSVTEEQGLIERKVRSATHQKVVRGRGYKREVKGVQGTCNSECSV